MYERATTWITRAGQLAQELMQQEIAIEFKSHKSDLVTRADREVESFLLQQIHKYYPQHNLLSEESGANPAGTSNSEESGCPYLWIIDPIDGTTNFINQKRDFCISVALCTQDKTVFGLIYDVAAGDVYRSFSGEGVFRNDLKLKPFGSSTLEESLVAISPHWRNKEEVTRWEGIYGLAPYTRGLRSYGATSIELCLLSTGRLHGYVSHHVYPWDYAAGRLFIEELGGVVSDLQGKPFL